MTTETKTKHRSWTTEEDNWLKECVLDKVRNGQTQQEAFAFIAEKTDRNNGAVAFRWNNKLRKENIKELKAAKAIAKSNKNKTSNSETDVEVASKKPIKTNDIQVLVNLPTAKNEIQPSTITVDYDDVISFINEKRDMEAGYSALKDSYDQLVVEHNNLKQNFDEVVAVVTKIKGS